METVTSKCVQKDDERLKALTKNLMALTLNESFCCGVGSKVAKCTCLAFALRGKEERCLAVARYQLYFDSLPHTERRMELVNWMRELQGDRKNYPVPFLEREDNALKELLSSKRLCKNAILQVLGKSTHYWATCKRIADSRVDPGQRKPNGLKNLPGN